MNVRTLFACIALVSIVFALAGCNRSESQSSGTTAGQSDNAGRCPHQIRKDRCPFCNPALVQSDGFCGEHGVAEALCHICRPYLKEAFRAKGDWCEAHKAPDSQCLVCHPELKDAVRPGEHGIPGTSG